MFDHRVSSERESIFDGFVNFPRNDFVLRRALKDYFEEKIRPRKLPHYVYRDVNADNLLNGSARLPPLIKPDTRLVSVLDLNGLKGVFQWAQNDRKYRTRWGTTFNRFPRDISDDNAVLDFLDEKMNGRAVQDFVTTVLDVLNIHRLEGKPFQPVWATRWAAFKDYAKEGPDRWHELLGMNKTDSRWLVLLRYTVREAGTIARPTQLDAGWFNQFHFPSPPVAPLTVGGHPMDLKAVSRKLLPEYIHKQLHYEQRYWMELAPDNYGRTTPSRLPTLERQRSEHHQLLIDDYGPTVRSWMVDPI